MSAADNDVRTAYRTCPLCEATCGLELKLDGDEVVSIRGDRDDVFSHGFICPKGFALKELHADPDRLRTPMIRQPDGSFAQATWDEALALIDERLSPILAADRNAVGVYLGNPNAHLLENMLYGSVLIRGLGTRNVYSASTVDQFPKQKSSALMFGTGTTVPVPDVDRTDHLMILGANPLVSNGSLMTAPDMRGRLRALRARGGKLVVIDPRRTRTAEEADEHHFIRPGTDAHLLFAMVNVMFDEALVHPGEKLESLADGIDVVRELADAVHSRGCRGTLRHPPRHHPTSGSRARRGGPRRRLRPDRDMHPGVRDAGQLARGCAQRPHGQPRS